MNKKYLQQRKRAVRTRSKIQGTKDRPRLSMYRSNISLSAQLIDDIMGKTLLGLSEKHLGEKKGNKTERAKAFGLFVAKKATQKKITTIIFDKGSYRYHGRVKAFAQGAREGGLKF